MLYMWKSEQGATKAAPVFRVEPNHREFPEGGKKNIRQDLNDISDVLFIDGLTVSVISQRAANCRGFLCL